jgi:hypothetical protein
MRRFDIGLGKALVWLVASLAFWWCGSTAAFAQSFDAFYDFSFTGCSCSGVAASGVFEFNFDPVNPGNTTLIGISGSVSGFANPKDNGSIQSLVGAPISSLGNVIPFTLSGGTNETLTLYSPFAELSTSHGETSLGSLDIIPAAAPIPGAGLLSYLVLALSGLLFRVKRISRRAHSALARLSFLALARLFAGDRGPRSA